MTDVQYHKNDPARGPQHRQNFSALQSPHGTNGVVLNQMKYFQVFKSSLLRDCFEDKKPKSALSANLQMVPSWDAMPSLGTKKWVQRNLTRHKAEGKCCSWVREAPGIKTGWGMKKLRMALCRRTWGCWWTRGCTWAGNVLSKTSQSTTGWAVSGEMWPTGQGRWFSLSTPVKPHLECCIQF